MGYSVEIDIRSVKSLAEELKRPEAAVRTTLKDLGVVVIDGHYNHDRYLAAYSEPTWLRNKRNEWSLSHDKGLGAVKYILDPLKVNIVQHDMSQANYLMLEGPSRVRSFVKLHFRNSWVVQKDRLSVCFDCKGFTDETQEYQHVMFVCIEGKTAWAFSRQQLISYYNFLRNAPPSYTDGVICRWNDRTSPNGGLHFWLNDDCPSLLTDKSQLGL